MKEAYLYEKLPNEAVRCFLCRQGCGIKNGERGLCGVRENQDGTLYTLVYDKIASINVDAIEKKPLYHFAPGSRSLSVGTVGCNYRCSFCQNYTISQLPRETGQVIGDEYTPAELVGMAVQHDCRSISYTYTEPTIFYELAKETMKEARKADLLNVFVTNGYMTREMLDDSRGLLDAANVDLKAFNEEFYKEHVNAKLEGVLDSLRYMKELGIRIEITTLVIPGLNDSRDELRSAARFIVNDLGPETPWHLSRFFPMYKEQDIPPTEVSTLQEAREIGMDEGLLYVYLGNVSWDPGSTTYCPSCSEPLIERAELAIKLNALDKGACPKCGTKIHGHEM